MDSVLTVGRYGIDEWIASGAMGVVFRGYDPVLHRPVAIKILRRELAKGSAAEGWHERFKRRARSAGRLFHPNITTTFDFGEDHGIPFIVMEYVDGSPLDRLLKTSGRLAPQRAVAIVRQVLDALKYSHENRVAHLDLKPSIIFVLTNDDVKIADFGVALVNASEPTSIEEVLETTPSMAPEQLMGTPVDHRTDLFAAGAILFELLTGAKPFRGASVADIVARMENRGPDDVCVLSPEVPTALRRVIETALAYEPGRRFATADEFSLALSEAVALGDEKLPAQLSANAAGWNVEILQKIEAELATHIGPVAAIAVKRSARQAKDLVALYKQSAVYIENHRERDEFLAGGRRLAAKMSERIEAAPLQNSANHPTSRENRPAGPPDPVMLDAIEARLAQYVGPIARILVRQQLKDFHSLPEFYHGLADHISDEPERAAFLNSVSVGS